MNLSKLRWGMLLMVCALLVQVGCSSMDKDRGDNGGIATKKSIDPTSIKAYWDGINQEVQIQFLSDVGTVKADVLNATGTLIGTGMLDSGASDQAIALQQAPSGEYTITFTDAQGEKINIIFTIP